MMSLIIIGLLVSLLGVAVTFAVGRAKQVRTLAEISNLDVAMQSYKTQFGSEYPPCMAIPIPSFLAPTPTRYDQFNRALRKRFPRYTLSYNAQWNRNTNDVAYILFNSWYVRNINDPSQSASNAIQLNLDKMDAAEALVFWLAGPPTPVDLPSPPGTGNFVATTVLWGFCANPTTPFAPKGSRAPFLYDFDETRLTDVDGDGWPEYSPPGTSNKTVNGAIAMAPYVYFDPSSYVYYYTNNNGQPIYTQPYFATYPTNTNKLPQPLPSAPIPAGLAVTAGKPDGEFGLAMPYAISALHQTANNNLPPYQYTFWNPKKFQIIAAGADNEYGGSIYEPPTTLGSSGGGRPFVPLMPQTANQGVVSQSPQYKLLGTPILLQGEFDNLTNFSDSKLEDYTPQ